MDLLQDIVIRPLAKNEPPPYELLLLADPSKEMIEGYLSNSSIYLALMGEKVVGEYVLYPLGGKEVEVKNIAVDPSLHGQGIGKLLLAHAGSTARSKGYRSMIIGTANSSVAQIYLYQQQGFQITGVKEAYFLKNYAEPIFENGERCVDQLILTKQL